jgi:hypothetical protein
MGDWLKSVLSQAFSLNQAGLILPDIGEDLTQQAQRAFITLLPRLGVLHIEGPDAGKFLQGQLSCDLGDISAIRGGRGLHCTPKGRVVASFLLLRSSEQGYDCVLPASALPLLQQALAKYIVFSKAALTDTSDQYGLIGLHGAAAEPVIESYFGTVPTAPLQQVIHAGALCLRLDGQQPRYQLLLPQIEAATFWRSAAGLLQAADTGAWDLLNIRAGIADIEAGTSELFIPQMLNYDKLGAISFNKGCYTGQEVVARAHYKGAVKRRMQGFRCAAAALPAPGSPVQVAGKNSGTVVAAVDTGKGLIEGLVVVAEEPIQAALLESQYRSSPLELTPLHYAEATPPASLDHARS